MPTPIFPKRCWISAVLEILKYFGSQFDNLSDLCNLTSSNFIIIFSEKKARPLKVLEKIARLM